MPWPRRGSFNKHTKKITSGRAREAGRKAANQALRSGKSDVSAIRIGKYVARRVQMAARRKR